MLLTMILGAAAGYGVGTVQPHVTQAVEKVDLLNSAIGEDGAPMFTLLVVLFFAALICVVVGVSANGAVLALFAAIGMFGQKLYEGFQNSRKAVEDAEVVEADDADDEKK